MTLKQYLPLKCNLKQETVINKIDKLAVVMQKILKSLIFDQWFQITAFK